MSNGLKGYFSHKGVKGKYLVVLRKARHHCLEAITYKKKSDSVIPVKKVSLDRTKRPQYSAKNFFPALLPLQGGK